MHEESFSGIQILSLCVAFGNLLLVLVVHAIWLYAWHVIGYRPRYGHPESWSNAPVVNSPFLGAFSIPCVMAMFYEPLFVAVITLLALARHRNWRMLFAIAALVFSYGALWCDPFDAVSWYLD